MAKPTRAQLEAFGAITYHYASAEAGIKIALAAMLELTLTELLTLTEPASSFDLRNLAKSIAKLRVTDAKEIERFCHLVGELGTFGPLRNAIGHSRWTKGARRGSIKPFHMDIRSGTAKFRGTDPNERDWTAKELQVEADRLYNLNVQLIRYMKKMKFFEDMAENTSETNKPTEA